MDFKNAPILDFKARKPTHQEVLEGLGQYMQEQLQIIHDQMTFMHEIQLAMMRQMADKKFLTPDKLIEMTHERFANDNFRVMISEIEQRFVEKYNAGLKVEHKRSFWHKVKDFFTGKDTSLKLTAQKQNETEPEVLSPEPMAEGSQEDTTDRAVKS